jgi:Protein of unknown function (DUF2721)
MLSQLSLPTPLAGREDQRARPLKETPRAALIQINKGMLGSKHFAGNGTECCSGLATMKDMVPLLPSVDQLSRIIGSVAAPAFLLGAVAAFISVLMSRMHRVIDRSQFLHGLVERDDNKAYLKADIPRLKRRAALLNKAIFYSTVCAIITGSLIIVAFVSAMLHLEHEYGVALLFIAALVFFVLALVNLASETRIALRDFDHHI